MHSDAPQPKKQKQIHRFTGNLTSAYTDTTHSAKPAACWE
jgi:hypothetical protein